MLLLKNIPQSNLFRASLKIDVENENKHKFISRGYSIGSCSVGVDYDFDANPDEIYAKKIDELDENEIMH